MLKLFFPESPCRDALPGASQYAPEFLYRRAFRRVSKTYLWL